MKPPSFKKVPKNIRLLVSGSLILILFWGTWTFIYSQKNSTPTYETATVSRGTLINSISASGIISSGNSTAISTKASGTVKNVYVQNGALVKKGDQIAQLSLDEYGIEQQAAAYAHYIAAIAAVKTAQKDQAAADIQMWKDQQAIIDAENAIKDKNGSGINPKTKAAYTEAERAVIDKTLDQARLAFDVSEYTYKTANAAIADAQAKATAAWRSYQESAAVITAPAEGIVSGLLLAPGMVVERVLNATGVSPTVTPQNIGEINNPDGQLQATVSLTQMDIVKVAASQKATLTLDAYSDKTFTGNVLSVDTKGSVSQNITSYPVTIILDKTETVIYPNMAVTAQIITSLKNDVLLIPTTAISLTNNQATVQVLKENKPVVVDVTVGEANDAQTEITSGLAEGDVVVTATVSPDTAKNTGDDISSPFGVTNRSRSGTSVGGNRTFIQMGGPPAGGF